MNISKLSEANMSQKKAPCAYEPLGNPEKQVAVDRNCSSISWFVILTCSVLALFLISLNSSSMFSSDGVDPVYAQSTKNPSATTFDLQSSPDNSTQISDNPSAKIFDAERSAENSTQNSTNPSAKTFDANTSAENSTEKLDNPSSKTFDAESSAENSTEKSENPSSKSFDAGSSAEKSAEKSDNSSDKNPSAKTSDAESSAENSAEKSDNPLDKNPDNATTISANQSAEKQYDCTGKYIHILDLPSEFNTDLLKNCSTLNPWSDQYCDFIKNNGFGLSLNVSGTDVFSYSGWYITDQFTLEIIFHNRMKKYRCLTNDSSQASAIYVPYYPGIDIMRYLVNPNNTLRDSIPIKFAEYLQQKPEWSKMGGRDHFLVLGRVTSDFGRTSETGGWGNCLFTLPGMRNMTSLLIEANPTSKSEIGIPYPTFFHPSSENEMQNWQQKMREKKRDHLFSFVGAPRPHMKGSIRNELIKQCVAAKDFHCMFLNCGSFEIDCRVAETVMRVFQSSDFCLQPPGDSYTRKSFFDTIISGCIPIIFHPASAYVEYLWHLPKDYSSYSILMPMDEVKNGSLSIEQRLLEIPREKVNAMREEVIKLIPRIIYANVDSNVEDAFEVTIKGVLDRVEMFKKEMKDGKNSAFENVPEYLAWKYNFFGDLDHHEWDKYFDGSISIY